MCPSRRAPFEGKVEMSRLVAVVWVLACLVCLKAPEAGAVTIALEASSETVDIGESFDVNLNISGLNEGGTPSLGVYDIDVLFDASLLALTSVTVGDPVLGEQLALVFPSITFIQPTAGGVNVFELSLDAPADLIALQTDAFTLVTLSFDAVGLGTAEFTPSVAALGDELGNPLSIDELIGTQVLTQIGTQAPPIPEPSAVVLFGLGLAVLRMRRDRALTRSPIA